MTLPTRYTQRMQPSEDMAGKRRRARPVYSAPLQRRLPGVPLLRVCSVAAVLVFAGGDSLERSPSPRGLRATFAAAALDEFLERLRYCRIHRRRLEGSQRVAPYRGRPLGGGLRAGLGPGTEVAPVGDERRVEGIAIALHRVRSGEEVTARADFRHRLDTDLVPRGGDRLEELGEHLQHLDIENELLERCVEATLEPAGGMQHEMTAAEESAPQAHLRLVSRLRIGSVARRGARAAPGHADAPRELSGAERGLCILRSAKGRRARLHVDVGGEAAVQHRRTGPHDLRERDTE